MEQILLLPVLLLSILVGTQSFAESSSNIFCSSIANLDIQNSTINNIKFLDGKACTSDTEAPDQCDWEHEISSNEILRPIAGKEVRLVAIHSIHKTGSGARDTILVLDCLNGSMRKIVEKKYLNGVKITKRVDGEFKLVSGEWQPKDPMCCPSKEKHETYRWSSSKDTYILESTTTSRKKLK